MKRKSTKPPTLFSVAPVQRAAFEGHVLLANKASYGVEQFDNAADARDWLDDYVPRQEGATTYVIDTSTGQRFYADPHATLVKD